MPTFLPFWYKLPPEKCTSDPTDTSWTIVWQVSSQNLNATQSLSDPHLKKETKSGRIICHFTHLIACRCKIYMPPCTHRYCLLIICWWHLVATRHNLHFVKIASVCRNFAHGRNNETRAQQAQFLSRNHCFNKQLEQTRQMFVLLDVFLRFFCVYIFQKHLSVHTGVTLEVPVVPNMHCLLQSTSLNTDNNLSASPQAECPWPLWPLWNSTHQKVEGNFSTYHN